MRSLGLLIGSVVYVHGCGDLTVLIASNPSSASGGNDGWGGSMDVNMGSTSDIGRGGEVAVEAPNEMTLTTDESGGGEGEGEGGSTGTGQTDVPPEPELGPPVFSVPILVDGINDPDFKDQDPSLPADQLEIFFFSNRLGSPDLFRSTRASIVSPWTPPVPVEELNDPGTAEFNPAISADGLRIWFCSSREPAAGIWYSDRPSRLENFDAPTSVMVERLLDENTVIGPTLTPDFLRMIVSIGAGETRDLYELSRPNLMAEWSSPKPLIGINSELADSTPFMYDGGHQILFESGRSGFGDLFWAFREDLSAEVNRVEALTALNDPNEYESHPHLTPDGRNIYFGSSRSGGTDIYIARLRESNLP